MKVTPCLVLTAVALWSACGLMTAGAAKPASGGVSVPLDGTWQIEESLSATDMPIRFTHTVPVPGMANLAQPAFPGVDQFDSLELISNRIRSGKLPESARVHGAGVPRQNRNYFWYRRTFRAPARRTVATLKINKAQFGTAVWLNGKAVGEYAGCFSAGIFDLGDAMDWAGENVLLIRIGAHPGVLPDTYPTGTDFEKLKWTPGIYDRVSVHFCDNPVIETVQVAPRIANSEIVVQTRVHNRGPAHAVVLNHVVRPWKGAGPRVPAEPLRLDLAAGENKIVTQTIHLPNARLWSPEDPFLYVVESRTGGDSVSTRFGMREFRCDTATQRCYLNGKVYYLRGSNITLHRFFEDPKCGHLPWEEKWLQKLLVEIPKKMHWNSFRFCIGPAPDRWLEIADEAGLLIQNEFFVWTGAPDWDKGYGRRYDAGEMIRQYGDWMRDNWNHPSVAIWDANNETKEPLFAGKIIPAVRPLDLSDRPWENSYNGPPGPNDPVEDHPYLFSRFQFGDQKGFRMTELEGWDGENHPGPAPADAHARILNEYGWLWLNRDGTPTLLTQKVYDQLLSPQASAQERFALDAYLLAGKTEYWRAHRHYAGVLHFVYLTCSYPGVYTSDHWLDVEKLKLELRFADYVAEAFKPLGVYVNFFQATLPAGQQRTFPVLLVNDLARPVNGTLRLTLESEAGRRVAQTGQAFALNAGGDQKLEMSLAVPSVQGKFLLKATALPSGREAGSPTVSRRWVTVQPQP
jgi:hypothetical protein